MNRDRKGAARRSVYALALLAGLSASAQEPDQPPPVQKETVVVTGTLAPIPLEEADRAVTEFPIPETTRLLVLTPFELLRTDPSIDVRSRAPNGVQSDVSIRGASFGQTLVLLDGMRFNNAQSGHHNFDLPLPLDAIDRLEALKGSGSMFYGSDAVGGVVNVIPRKPEATEFRLRAGIGNFGTNVQSGTLATATTRWTEQLSFERDFSTGFRPDRDYRNLSLASTTTLTTAAGTTRILLATNDRPFGADQFYGNYPSWERTRGWFVGIRQELGDRMEATLDYRRHTDLFVLYRDRPEVFTNRHADDTWQAAFRRHDPLGSTARIYYGVEGYRDRIESTNLGYHHRSRGAVYAAIDARALRRYSFTAGLREEVYGSGETQLSPTIAAGAWLAPTLKLRASASRAFRLPSFTDLYYHDPANVGSPDLRPEKAWNYEGGLEWSPNRRFRAEGDVFQRRERDGIDYVRATSADIWRATNFQRLRFTGVELATTWTPREGQIVEARFTGLAGVQEVVAGLQSKYAFNYPSRNFAATYTASIGGVVARTRIGALKREARDPYALWDVSVGYARGRIRPFIQAANVTSTPYEEIAAVAMPGRSILGGIELIILGAR